jgi:uncharacterized membrane protein YgaE (UPF0421/DUF939 family)
VSASTGMAAPAKSTGMAAAVSAHRGGVEAAAATSEGPVGITVGVAAAMVVMMVPAPVIIAAAVKDAAVITGVAVVITIIATVTKTDPYACASAKKKWEQEKREISCFHVKRYNSASRKQTIDREETA